MSQSISRTNYPLLLNPNSLIDENKAAITLVSDRLERTSILVESATYRYFAQMKIGVFKYIKHPSINFFDRSLRDHIAYHIQTGRIAVESVSDDYLVSITKKGPTWVIEANIVFNFIKKLGIEELDTFRPLSISSRYLVRDMQSEEIKVNDPILAAIKRIDLDLFLCLFDSAQHDGKPTGMDQKTFDRKIKEALQTIKDRKNDKTKSLCQDDLVYLSNKDAHLLNEQITYQSLILKTAESVHLPESLINENCLIWAIERIRWLGIVFDEIDNQSITNATHFYIIYSKDAFDTIINAPSLEERDLIKLKEIDTSAKDRSLSTPEEAIRHLESKKFLEKFSIIGHGINTTVSLAIGCAALLNSKHPESKSYAIGGILFSLIGASRIKLSVDNLRKLDKIKQDVIRNSNSSQN